jgi:hypothetical protein
MLTTSTKFIIISIPLFGSYFSKKEKKSTQITELKLEKKTNSGAKFQEQKYKIFVRIGS